MSFLSCFEFDFTMMDNFSPMTICIKLKNSNHDGNCFCNDILFHTSIKQFKILKNAEMKKQLINFIIELNICKTIEPTMII